MFRPIPVSGVAEALANKTAGLVICTESSAGQLLASRIATVYVPGARLLEVAVVSPFDQRKVTGCAAPETLAVALPSAAPLQLTFVTAVVAEIVQLKLLTVTVCTAVQALLSVMVTV